MKRILFLIACTMAFLSDAALAQTTKTIYFVRHAESENALFQQGQNGKAFVPDCTPFFNEGILDECCTEVLTPLGSERAKLLARWFRDKGLLPTITHVISTYKVRSVQTVLPTAQAAGLAPHLNGDLIPDGADVDKNAGDGVQEIPAFVDECERGYEVAHNFYPQVVEHLGSLPLGSGIVVVGHSASLYPIMESLGVVTTNALKFPRNAEGRTSGFNNLWVVEMDANNVGMLSKHVRLNFALTETVTP